MLHRNGRAKTKSGRRRRQKSGTGAPCHVARTGKKFCRLVLAARVWLGGVFSAAARVFPEGEKPIFQTLYKGGKA